MSQSTKETLIIDSTINDAQYILCYAARHGDVHEGLKDLSKMIDNAVSVKIQQTRGAESRIPSMATLYWSEGLQSDLRCGCPQNGSTNLLRAGQRCPCPVQA